MSDVRRMQRAYAMIRELTLPTTLPVSGQLPGVVDIHVHVGVGLIDPLELGLRATAAGMRAIVFKTPSPTLDLALTVNAALRRLAAGQTPVECIGGVVLETAGPPHAAAARRWLEKGARVVWFATGSSANHRERAHGLPRRTARRSGQYVLKGGALIPEAIEVIETALEFGAALSFGHLSREELVALAREAERRGLTRAFVDHPLNPVMGLAVDDCARLASHGVWLNFTAAELSPMFGVDPAEMGRAIRAAGVDRVVLSSDAGHPTMADPVEAMRMWRAIALWQGFSEREIDQMMVANPARVIGLPEIAPATGG
ncbi:MAG: DUF6282 family protein [Chloroflexota bacterium]|nr:DUF6282 family protein [Dehalococcoidia bacterium]MDW8252599.1 DUF6282 family protein [Chloroflexota bacterium]